MVRNLTPMNAQNWIRIVHIKTEILSTFWYRLLLLIRFAARKNGFDFKPKEAIDFMSCFFKIRHVYSHETFVSIFILIYITGPWGVVHISIIIIMFSKNTHNILHLIFHFISINFYMLRCYRKHIYITLGTVTCCWTLTTICVIVYRVQWEIVSYYMPTTRVTQKYCQRVFKPIRVAHKEYVRFYLSETLIKSNWLLKWLFL